MTIRAATRQDIATADVSSLHCTLTAPDRMRHTSVAAKLASWLVVAVIALVAASFAAGALSPRTIGHDDAIYASTATSLRTSSQYRLVTLPTHPRQTKYPPLYPIALGSVLAPDRTPSEQVLRLKSLNLLFFSATILLTAGLLQEAGLSHGWEYGLPLLLLASSPGLLASTDSLMTEQLFTCLLAATFVAAPKGASASVIRVTVTAVLAALAALTRSVGIAACAGLVWYLLRTKGTRSAIVAGVLIACVVGPWWMWVAGANPRSLNVLEQYYVAYEPSAWSYLSTDPRLAFSVLAGNARGFLAGIPTVTGLATPVPVTVAASLGAVGLWCASGSWVTRLFAPTVGLYVLLVLAHPMNMARYLVPLLPVGTVLLAIGAARIKTVFAKNGDILAPLVGMALCILVAGNLLWARHYRQMARTSLHAEFGRAFPFDWQGFQEVIDWIGRHTPRDAVVASGYDTTYALYTGRMGIRPWLHQPETYDPLYGRYGQWSIDAAQVQSRLDQLGVRYMVVDPLLPDGLGSHGRATMDELLRAPTWTLRFVSTDQQHRVYERTFVLSGAWPQ